MTEGLAIYTIDKRNFQDPNYSFISFTQDQMAKLKPKRGQLIEKLTGRTFSKNKLKTGILYLEITVIRVNL